MRTKKHSRSVTAAAALGVSLLAAAAAVFTFRSDLRFMSKEVIWNLTVSSGLSEADMSGIELEEVPVKQINVGTELMLVNREHPLAEDYTPHIVEYRDTGVLIDPSVSDSFARLSKDVKERYGDEWGMYVMSSYRTAEEQAEIENEQGSDTAMPPDCSEHRTGLALDVYFSGYAGRGIINCEPGRYLNAGCADYGFIIRYPLMKSDITGIDYEPWHMRYVGLPHSQIMDEANITLEEYIATLEPGRFYRYEGYLISRQTGNTLMIPKGWETSVSTDNCGGYVVTSKR